MLTYKRFMLYWIIMFAMQVFPNVAVSAEEALDKEVFTYQQDFEETDPVSLWGSDGEYTVNFKGITEEKAFSGKKSLKLDVTFSKGSFCYFMIPVKFPAEGDVKFEARMYVDEKSTGKAGIGCGLVFKPTLLTNNMPPFASYGPSANEWKLVERDLVKFGKEGAETALRKRLWGVNESNVVKYCDRIGIFLFGKPGQRVVVYIDNIEIKGEVLTEKACNVEIKQRWSAAEKILKDKLSIWEDAIKEIESEVLNRKNDLSANDRAQKINDLKTDINRIRARGFMLREECLCHPGAA